MVPALRKQYNEQFSEEQYRKFIDALENVYPGQLDFRVAETPVFVPKAFTEKMIAACDHIIDVIQQPDYLRQSRNAIPAHLNVPGEDAHPHCVAFDFGVCFNEAGELEPQLIELQGFPSLFAWEVILPEVHSNFFWTPENHSVYLNKFDRNSYVALLGKLIIGDARREEVILLEILPEQQKTRVDFYATEDLIGIKTVCLTKLIVEGRQLYYENKGKKTRIRRIYNRVIFDDLFRQPEDIQQKGKIFQQELDVQWVPHPNWFYKLSKYTMPFISHPFVPHTKFLNEGTLPDDLENYVVKPLFSFAGQGVIIDVTKDEIEKIPDPENWIIQRKVNYAPVITTPDEPAKAEIRIFYFWPEGAKRPVPANNLARLSKGKMIGVRYNKDREWVGGTFCLFEQD
jgi:hypothetical protein